MRQLHNGVLGLLYNPIWPTEHFEFESVGLRL